MGMFLFLHLRMSQRHFVQNNRIMMITTVTIHREPFFANPAFAHEAIDCLYRTQSLHPFFLYGFVIMPDHCHFLLKVTAPALVSRTIGIYKSGLTFDLGIGKMWQERFYIRLPDAPSKTLHYIHLNPVRAGLSETIEAYPWSSAGGRWDVSPLDV